MADLVKSIRCREAFLWGKFTVYGLRFAAGKAGGHMSGGEWSIQSGEVVETINMEKFIVE